MPSFNVEENRVEFPSSRIMLKFKKRKKYDTMPLNLRWFEEEAEAKMGGTSV